MIDVPLKVEISDYSLGSPVVKISISLQASEVREVVEESALQARGEHTHHLSRNVKASDLELVQHFPTTTSSLGRSTDQLMPSLAFKVSGIIIISTKSYIWVQNCFSFFSKQISFFFKIIENFYKIEYSLPGLSRIVIKSCIPILVMHLQCFSVI